MSEHKYALITGASRGIGAACADLLAKDGFNIAVNYKNDDEAAHSVVEKVRHHNRKCLLLKADMSDEEAVVNMFKTLDNEHCTLAALVNNVGILLPQSRLVTIDSSRLRKLFSANVFSAFIASREAVKRLGKSYGGAGGSIVNISSAAARLGSPFEYIDYAATKGAIDTLTIGLSKEVAAEGIRVNAVRPGIIDTEIHASGGEPNRVKRLAASIPMQRAGRATEVAEAVSWLISDKASYCTGAFIDLAGGR